MKPDGAKVLVTGGASGIGEPVGELFLREGADVIVFDREEPEYEARHFEVDVRREEEVAEAFGEIDRLDTLVNNTGVYRRTPIEEFNSDVFDEIFETNLKGYRSNFTHALPMLRESSDGNVVNVSSGLAERPEPESDLYSASKAAANAMKTSWANSYAETGVRANAVLPGPVRTEMLTETFTDDALEDYRGKQPERRFVEPDEVAEAVLALASNEAYNGAELEVGGEAHNNRYGL